MREGVWNLTEKLVWLSPNPPLPQRSPASRLHPEGTHLIGAHGATLLLTKNVNPKVVSEMLGHSNIAITLDTYSHVLPNMQDSAARALEEALR